MNPDRVGTIASRDRGSRVAARVSWGREETYIIYRSLGPPAPCVFLGYQTSARFLIGQFTTDGDFKPIFTVDLVQPGFADRSSPGLILSEELVRR